MSAELVAAGAKGLVLGFSIAAPVGPIGLLCIRKTLNEGPAAGIACGAGAATADALFGLAAALGLTAVAAVVRDHQTAMKLIGGLTLLWLGWRSFNARPPARAAEVGARNLLGDYAATFGLTLTNPVTILSSAAVFAGMGVGAGGAGSALSLVAGVLLGSLAWWLLLAGGVSLARRWMTPARTVWINRAAGAGLMLFGLVLLGSMVVGA